MAKESEKILLVDDDDFLLDMYAVKFKEQGFDLDIAHNGTEAIEKLKNEKYRVILLDVVMPTLDGFDVMEHLKKEKLAEDSLLIVLTNLGQKDDVDRGIALGADDYIIKANFTPSEVVEKVRSLLSTKGS